MAMPVPSSRLLLPVLALLLALAPGGAAAEVRAWLDRDRIASGETTTLNIETDAGGRPDYAPLAGDFRIEQRSSRQTFEQVGGQPVTRTLYAVALRPLRSGRLTVPALRVGAGRTAPLALVVEEAAAAPARARGPAFIEAEVDDPAPYVQQSVGLRLRLYYATQLLSGQLDQPAPDGAALRREGSDVQYTRDIGGRRYQVVERRYLLVPERSGTLRLPAARFSGRGAGGWLDDLFGDGQRTVTAAGPALVLQVKPVPAAAPRPWLPLHGLELRWLEHPQALRAGEAATIGLELVAEGATAAQLESPEISADMGAQVFPEPAQHDETFEDGRPTVRLVRTFSVLPARDGRLRVHAPRLEWWDVAADRVRVASLPPLEFEVAPAVPGAGAAAAPGQGEDRWVRLPGVQGEVHAWALATVVFAFLWLGTLAWGLRWRQRAQPAGAAAAADATAAAPGARPGRGGPGTALRKALDTGDLADVATALCALSSPPSPDLDALSRLLAPGAQRDALATLQQVRWGPGEDTAAAARAAVREAFARGPEWLPRGDPDDPALPPLYPR